MCLVFVVWWEGWAQPYCNLQHLRVCWVSESVCSVPESVCRMPGYKCSRSRAYSV